MPATFVTENGKELKIFQIKNSALYKVAFATGGELPPELDQMFTNPLIASKAIEKYLEKRKTSKAKVNGKTAE